MHWARAASKHATDIDAAAILKTQQSAQASTVASTCELGVCKMRKRVVEAASVLGASLGVFAVVAAINQPTRGGTMDNVNITCCLLHVDIADLSSL